MLSNVFGLTFVLLSNWNKLKPMKLNDYLSIMKKLTALLTLILAVALPAQSQTGSLEDVLNWLETECAEDTTGLAEYCDLLELAIACGEGDSIACVELEIGIQDILEDTDSDDGEDDYEDGDEFDNDIEGWLGWLEMECEEDSLSDACLALELATACLEGDSVACNELESLIDMYDWDDSWEDDSDDDDEDGDDDDEDDDDGDDDGDDDDEDGDDDDGDDDGDDDDDEDGDDTNTGGSSDVDCNAEFLVTQVMDADSSLVPGMIWIYIYDYDASQTYFWDFGNEGTSTDPFPMWAYDANGPYTVCLTVSDSLADCSATFCENIELDSLGYLGGFMDGFSVTVLDGGASDQTANVVLERAPAAERLVVFPNPTSGEAITVNWVSRENGPAELDVFDLRGARVTQTTISATTGQNSVALNLSGMESGFYLVQLMFGDVRMTQRLVIQ